MMTHTPTLTQYIPIMLTHTVILSIYFTGNSRAASIETAGYAILAMMTHDPINMEPQARKIVKWITAQRNGQGGFYSTQVRCG